MNERSRVDRIVARVIENLTPKNWEKSTLMGGLFNLKIRMDIHSLEDGSISGEAGISSGLHHFRNMKGCVLSSLYYDGVEATVHMALDDAGILLEKDPYEGWFGTFSFFEDEEFKPIKIGHGIFYRGEYYISGQEIPGLKIVSSGYYATYRRV